MTTRTIKKYPNRRLYDTERSRYITVCDVRDLVINNVDFKVIDANTKEDITRNTLLQIIIEQESEGEPLFTTEVLSRMIRFYGDTAQDVFTTYLERSTSLFVEQQRQMRDQIMRGVLTNPMNTFAELTQRNLDLWRDIQYRFMQSSSKKSKTSRSRGASESED